MSEIVEIFSKLYNWEPTLKTNKPTLRTDKKILKNWLFLYQLFYNDTNKQNNKNALTRIVPKTIIKDDNQI